MYQLNIFSNHQAPKKRFDYQHNAINDVINAFNDGIKKVCLVLPTGAGKTFCTGEIIKELNFNKSVFLVPKVKLKHQALDEFNSNQVFADVNTIQAINPTVLTKNGKYLNYLGYQLIVLDECHLVAWWNNTEWLLNNNPNALLLGVTATPDRSSSKQFIEDKFDKIIYPIHFGDLVDKEKLCNPRYFVYGAKGQFDNVNVSYDTGDFVQQQLDEACEQDGFIDNIVRNLVNLDIKSRKSIIFCASIKESKKLAELLTQAGIVTNHVDGTIPDSEQDKAISDLVNGANVSAISCAKLLIEGFDSPRIDTVILATATNSKTNLIQMCGRGSRIHPDKNLEFWVIDFGDNFARLKLGLKQRFPYKTRFDSELKTRKAPYKKCPTCGQENANFARVCVHCGHVFEIEPKPTQDVRDFDLVEVAVDFVDIYHLKHIRKLVRDAYKNGTQAYPNISKYLKLHNISTAASKKLLSPRYLKGAIFNKKSLENYLSHLLYTTRMVKETNTTFNNELLNNEFGENHRAYFGKLINRESFYYSWFDYFGLMPIQSGDKELINHLYQQKLKSLTYKLKTQDIQDGINDIDAIFDDTDSISDDTNLNQELALLQWAYDMFTIVSAKI
jgi:superfamily II DNA or RNA helicase